MKTLQIFRPALLLMPFSLCLTGSSQNVAINTTGVAADPSALLDVKSTTAGVLIPRMTTAQRNAISSPAVGLQIFNTDCEELNYWTGTCWLSSIKTLPNPGAITSAPSSTSVCAGASVTYSIAAVTGATSYLWTVPGGATINSGQGGTTISVTFGTNSGSICVSATDACETSGQSCLPVNVSSAISASAGSNRSVFCSGLIGGSPVASGGNAPYAYSWNPSTGLSNITAANPIASPTVTTSYTVTVTDANGCSATSSMTLTIGGGSPVVFIYTGAIQAWTVPAGVTCVQIQAYGASGGSGFGSGAIGGLGGYVYGTLSVTPGSGLYVYVGQQGGNGSAIAGSGGWNGGGNGGYWSATLTGGGGGGATDVRLGGTALSNRFIVGGGGGGGSSNGATSTGGAGGYSTGGNGLDAGSYNATYCGAGGTQSAGGAGASTGGSAGALGTGGSSAASSSVTGGGGGGYYGGGSGEASSTPGGGGGGSSYYGTLSSPGNTNGVQLGNGVVIITY